MSDKYYQTEKITVSAEFEISYKKGVSECREWARKEVLELPIEVAGVCLHGCYGVKRLGVVFVEPPREPDFTDFLDALNDYGDEEREFGKNATVYNETLSEEYREKVRLAKVKVMGIVSQILAKTGN